MGVVLISSRHDWIIVSLRDCITEIVLVFLFRLKRLNKEMVVVSEEEFGCNRSHGLDSPMWVDFNFSSLEMT